MIINLCVLGALGVLCVHLFSQQVIAGSPMLFQAARNGI
jgi:hypothetical protein